MSTLSTSDALYASGELSEQANRAYCSTCGYPLAGTKCDVCGGSSASLELEDGSWSPAARKRAGAHPELDWAFEAWSKQDYARLVTHCLAVEGVRNARTFNLADGPAFIAVVRSTSLLIALRPASDTLIIEAPVGRLPHRQRVPAMRVALELSHDEEHAGRLCVRKEWVLARFVGRLSAAEPTALLRALGELCQLTHRSAALLAASFDARSLTDADHLTFSWDAIPKPRKLGALGVSGAEEAPSKKPSTKQPMSSGMFGSVPSILGQDEDEGAPTLVRMDPTPAPLDVARAAAQGKVAQRSSSSGSIPAVLAPSHRFAAMPHTAPSPGVQAAPASRGGSSAAVAQAAAPSAHPSAPPSAPAPAPAPSVPPPRPLPPPTPTDALCDMLSVARELANTLTYEAHSATLMLLLRATVYRAVYEHTDTMPQAVAHLFHATSSMMREIWLTAPGKRRGSMQIPRPESALIVLEDIVAKRGEFSGQPPVKILPMTSAQQAKEHLARYVSEIDVAPNDPVLRHHIALGALSELLVRTKLPAPTQQKLRGIVAHAAKEGPTPASLELVLTALKRIIG